MPDMWSISLDTLKRRFACIQGLFTLAGTKNTNFPPSGSVNEPTLGPISEHNASGAKNQIKYSIITSRASRCVLSYDEVHYIDWSDRQLVFPIKNIAQFPFLSFFFSFFGLFFSSLPTVSAFCLIPFFHWACSRWIKASQYAKIHRANGIILVMCKKILNLKIVSFIIKIMQVYVLATDLPQRWRVKS